MITSARTGGLKLCCTMYVCTKKATELDLLPTNTDTTKTQLFKLQGMTRLFPNPLSRVSLLALFTYCLFR